MWGGKVLNVVLLCVVLLLLSVLIERCNSQDDSNKSIAQIIDLQNQNNTLNKTIDDKNREITKANNIILTKDSQIEAQLKHPKQNEV